MRRTAALAAMGLMLALAPGFAQHHETVSEKTTGEPGAGEASGTMELWKWANFALLAGGLGWVVKKNAGPFFESRSRSIRKQIVEAEEIRAEAFKRIKDVEARLANLAADIEALKRESSEEQKAETEQLRAQAAAELAKIELQGRQEIDAAGKQARLELKRYSAQLAVGLAEKKIRANMTAAAQQNLVDSFVENLEPPAKRAQST
jgi:F-type H+-transporting ATPase subunit b